MNHPIASRRSGFAGIVLLLTPAWASTPYAVKAAPPPSQAIERMAADRNTYELLTVDVPGGIYTTISAITNGRLAVGNYCTDVDCNGMQSFLWRQGKLEPLVYEAEIVYMFDINNVGFVFGTVGSAEATHAALFQVSTLTWTLLPDVPQKPMNYGFRMNQTGFAVGQACEGNWAVSVNCVSWIWNGTSYFFVPVLPGISANWTGTICINDWGQRAGQFLDGSGHLHGYILNGQQPTPVDMPGATDTRANDNNDLGHVLFDGFFADGSNQIYIWRKGVLTPLPGVDGAANTYSFGINGIEDYTGAWYDANGNGHGFIAFHK